MGTHPIFESDFDCLTVIELESVTISSPKIIEHPWNMRELIAKQDDFDQQERLLELSKEEIFRLRDDNEHQRTELERINREKENFEKKFEKNEEIVLSLKNEIIVEQEKTKKKIPKKKKKKKKKKK